MKAIVHVGMSKTGSTSLQKTLHKNRALLARRGLLYPTPTRHPHHIYLLPAVLGEGEWMRELGPPDPDRVARIRSVSEAAWAALDREAGASGARAVVLSSEHVIGLRPPTLARLWERLRARFDDVRAVGYVRSPIGHYLSHVQQSLKHSGEIGGLSRDLLYRRKIEKTIGVTGAERLSVRVFARERLIDGCVCRDFLRSAAGLAAEDVAGVRVVRDNASLSAEGMALLQSFNRMAWGGTAPFGNETNRRLIRLIQFEETKRDYTRPVLRDGLARDLVASSHDGLSWLDADLGLRFPDVGDPAGWSAEAGAGPAPRDVADVCAVDPDRLERMRMQLMKKLIGLVPA